MLLELEMPTGSISKINVKRIISIDAKSYTGLTAEDMNDIYVVLNKLNTRLTILETALMNTLMEEGESE